MILLDANILLRMADSKNAQYALTVNAVFHLRTSDTLVVIPQTLHEFWAVATRGTQHNGLGMDTPRAERWLARYRQMFPILHETADTLDVWQSLVSQFAVKGFRAHDAKYVAAMLTHGISQLLTYNIPHFKPFPIQIIDPGDLKIQNK